MKRRDFVIGASSAAGLLFANTVRGAVPCPPDLNASSVGQILCPQPTGNSGLADHASQINPGEWQFSVPLPSDIGQYDISWQNRTGFWDDVHREIQFMGKAQGGGPAKHWIYSEASNRWRRTSGNVADDKMGHIWLVSFDHVDDPGDYYYLEQDPGTHYGPEDTTRTIRKMSRSVENGAGEANSPWTTLANASFQIWSTSDTPNPGFCYHPNLLGSNRSGIFCWSTVRFAWWDKGNNEWTEGDHFGLNAPYGDRNGNTSLYVPGRDIAIFGCSKNGSQQALIIPAGYNGDSTPRLENLPIRVQSSTTGNTAHMLLDPRDSGTIMLLERDGNRVWTNSESGEGDRWVLESYRHPFWDNLPVSGNDAGAWTPCSIARYGVVLGMASYGSAANDGAGGTIMWRPG